MKALISQLLPYYIPSAGGTNNMGQCGKAATAAALLLRLATPALAANHTTCLLDELPGTASDVAAQDLV